MKRNYRIKCLHVQRKKTTLNPLNTVHEVYSQFVYLKQNGAHTFLHRLILHVLYFCSINPFTSKDKIKIEPFNIEHVTVCYRCYSFQSYYSN